MFPLYSSLGDAPYVLRERKIELPSNDVDVISEENVSDGRKKLAAPRDEGTGDANKSRAIEATYASIKDCRVDFMAGQII